MKRRINSTFLIIAIFFAALCDNQAQFKSIDFGDEEISVNSSSINLVRSYETSSNLTRSSIEGKGNLMFHGVEVLHYNENGMPLWLNRRVPVSREQHISELIEIYGIRSLGELEIQDETDDGDYSHVKLTQNYNGIEVHGAEIILHERGGLVELSNGELFPTPDLGVNPSINELEAINQVKEVFIRDGAFNTLDQEQLEYISGEQIMAELIIYHLGQKQDKEKLCWKVEISPNVAERWIVFLDAHTSEVYSKLPMGCKFSGNHSCENELDHNFLPPGPETAVAQDLGGQNRTINVYEIGGTYFMIDATRSMFNAGQSDLPNSPVGTIWTVDGNNTSPFGNNFQASHVFSNNNSWSDKSAVSAHYNGGKAYEYFKTVHGRESINGSGGNIMSFVNVADMDGSGLDNAFWNGQAMFYGNGNSLFSPLAEGLDVAGHEMSHGVIQTTANLEYKGQSGALNESFADIFGAMIDRDDWQMGEDIVASNQYPSGALRDLENPNQGLAGPNQIGNGWQPDHMDEFVELENTPEQDNGGVHINSGIVNKAFHLFASSIGKDKAEDVYYLALNSYLTKTSQFADMRLAAEAAAGQLFGQNSNEKQAATDAFVAVGIGTNGGGGGQEDVETNPGSEYILCTDADLNTLYIYDVANDEVIHNPIVIDGNSVDGPISKPSLTDDGRTAIYVAADNTVRELVIDYQTGEIQEFLLGADPIWRNAVISKDGARIATVLQERTNEIVVFDFSTGYNLVNTFELYNPTFSDPDIQVGNVDFADAMEFDFTGESLIYDAQSTIESDFGDDIVYWDINFIEVWNTEDEEFGTGQVEKLFSQLPENTSIGNPTFSKNSPFIIAFDFLDENNGDLAVLGVNLELNEVGTIYENNLLGYPSYSVEDDFVLFDHNVNGERRLSAVPIKDNKIQGDGSRFDILIGGRWGTWYADGERQLTRIEENEWPSDWTISPNPATDNLTIDLNTSKAVFAIYNSLGVRVSSGIIRGKEDLRINDLQSGLYILELQLKDELFSNKFLKH